MISSHPPVNIHALPRWVISAEQCVINYQSCIHQDKLLDCSRFIHPLEKLDIELGLHHFYLHDTEASKAKFKVSKVVVKFVVRKGTAWQHFFKAKQHIGTCRNFPNKKWVYSRLKA